MQMILLASQSIKIKEANKKTSKKKIPDLSVLAAEKSKMQKKSPKLGAGLIDPQHYGTIGFLNGESKKQNKSPKLGAGLTDPQHHGTIGSLNGENKKKQKSPKLGAGLIDPQHHGTIGSLNGESKTQLQKFPMLGVEEPMHYSANRFSYGEQQKLQGKNGKGRAGKADFSQAPMTSFSRSRNSNDKSKSAFAAFGVKAQQSSPIVNQKQSPTSDQKHSPSSGQNQGARLDNDVYQEPTDPRFSQRKKAGNLRKTTVNKNRTIEGDVVSVESNCMFYCAYMGSIKEWADFIWGKYRARVKCNKSFNTIVAHVEDGVTITLTTAAGIFGFTGGAEERKPYVEAHLDWIWGERNSPKAKKELSFGEAEFMKTPTIQRMPSSISEVVNNIIAQCSQEELNVENATFEDARLDELEPPRVETKKQEAVDLPMEENTRNDIAKLKDLSDSSLASHSGACKQAVINYFNSQIAPSPKANNSKK